MDKKVFFDAIRKDFPLTEGNVAGFDLLLDYAESNGIFIKDAAYVLGTAYHETAHTMQPVKEAYWLSEDWRKKNLRYYPWYGRGYVQLTWEDNYKKAGQKLGIDLTTNADVALDPEVAKKVLFIGMLSGWFTGKKLADYITRQTNQTYALTLAEFKNARRIVNGTDKDDEIAALALKLYKGLQKANYSATAESTPKPTEPSVQPPVVVETPIPVPNELELVLKRGDLSKVTLEDFYNALKSLYGDK